MLFTACFIRLYKTARNVCLFAKEIFGPIPFKLLFFFFFSAFEEEKGKIKDTRCILLPVLSTISSRARI